MTQYLNNLWNKKQFFLFLLMHVSKWVSEWVSMYVFNISTCICSDCIFDIQQMHIADFIYLWWEMKTNNIHLCWKQLYKKIIADHSMSTVAWFSQISMLTFILYMQLLKMIIIKKCRKLTVYLEWTVLFRSCSLNEVRHLCKRWLHLCVKCDDLMWNDVDILANCVINYYSC